MYKIRVSPFALALSPTCENVNLDLGGGGVVRDAIVEAGVGCVGVLHQQIDRGPLRLLGDDLDAINLSILHVLFSKKPIYYSTETPLRGPRKEISSSPCSHLTVSGGLSVFRTTQLMLTMLPTSTNKSGPPMM